MKIDFDIATLSAGPLLIGTFPGCYVDFVDFTIGVPVEAGELNVGTLSEPALLTTLGPGDVLPSLDKDYSWLVKKEFVGGALYLSATGITLPHTGTGSVYVLFYTGV